MDEGTFLYYRFKFEAVLPVDKGAKVLEIGTGTGKFLATLKRLRYENIVGVDVSAEMVQIAREVAGVKVKHVEDVPKYLGTVRQQFDCIFMLDVIEHVEKGMVIAFLRAVKAALKKGGVVVLTTENMASPIGRIQHYLDFTHEYNYTEISLRQVLEIAGFEDVEIWEMKDRMPLNPKSLLLWVIRRLWFMLLRLMHNVERPGGVVPTIYGKEIIASCCRKK